MLTVFVLLLMIKTARCTDTETLETKTVSVGEEVKLTCPRNYSGVFTNLFWIRLVSGAVPEFLGGSFIHDSDFAVSNVPHITAKQKPGAFVLIIRETQISDSGLYFCLNQDSLKMSFLTQAFLNVKGHDSDITTVVKDLSDPVPPGDSQTLRCSLLFDSDSKTCPGNNSVFWFRSGSDESHPSLIFTHGNRGDECGSSSEAGSPHQCDYSFTTSFSSSEAETFYCAVAACGRILFGEGQKIHTEDAEFWMAAVYLLLIALALSLIFIAYLIYIIKRKPREAAAARPANAESAADLQQRKECALVYSAPAFTKRRADKAERRKARGAEGETVYSDVRSTCRPTVYRDV